MNNILTKKNFSDLNLLSLLQLTQGKHLLSPFWNNLEV